MIIDIKFIEYRNYKRNVIMVQNIHYSKTKSDSNYDESLESKLLRSPKDCEVFSIRGSQRYAIFTLLN